MFSIKFAKRLMQHPDIVEHRRYKDSNDNLTGKKYLKQRAGSSYTVSSSDESDEEEEDADQICYSVLCVFSYVAAGQDQNQKKNPVVITPQIQDIHAQQKQQHQQQQQQQQHHTATSTTAGGSTTTTLSCSRTTTHLPSQQQNSNRQQTITIRHTQPMQKPSITTSTVQPQSRLVHTNARTHTTATTTISSTNARGAIQQQQQQQHPPPSSHQYQPQQQHHHHQQPQHQTTTTTSHKQLQKSTSEKISSQPKAHPPLGARKSSSVSQTGPLPQLPPRIPSQHSTESLVATSPTPSTGSTGRTSRGPPPGPPPAIPPRTGAIARSGSVQHSTMPTNQMSGGGGVRPFVRQISTNSTPPQYTPQPPPAFVIPKRHTTMQRASSMATPNPTIINTAALFTTCMTAGTASSAANTSAAPSTTSTTPSPSSIPSPYNNLQKRPSYGSVSLGSSLSTSPGSNGGGSGGGSSSTSPQGGGKDSWKDSGKDGGKDLSHKDASHAAGSNSASGGGGGGGRSGDEPHSREACRSMCLPWL
ncbi:MAP kinase-activating death domain protein-like [Musca vetustissima]|uniref:MAP kinase-activating death domain protein-like n=1 Tax=Musca vetustissima TaxID=27455 RepID=UPI002AB6D3BE|nr:MAP kinase-activating death domain protein-like [Musca vetustissima]